MSNICVITLNWNDWETTIECLESLHSTNTTPVSLVVVDNGSENDSVDNLLAWAQRVHLPKVRLLNYTSSQKISVDDSYSKAIQSAGIREMILVHCVLNYGFAKGNNIGLEVASMLTPDQIFILNNDTVVVEDTLEKMVSAMESHQNEVIVVPRIDYHSEPGRVWYAGGDLTWYGSRKYYNRGRRLKDISPIQQRVTFITGCAFLAPYKLLNENGLFSERFFFGEEDYDFSLRMKKANIELVLEARALVLHKDGISRKNALGADGLSAALIYYTNRIVDLKLHYRYSYWLLWRMIWLAGIFLKLTIGQKLSISRSYKILSLIRTYSWTHNEVDSTFFWNAGVNIKVIIEQ